MDKDVDQLKIGGRIGISGQYTVVAYNDNLVKESNSIIYHGLDQTGNSVNVYNLNIGGKIYPIIFSVTGGKVNGISADTDKATLIVDISSISNGRLIMELQNLIDVKNSNNNVDSDYQVVADGQNSIFSEVANNNHARLLAIDFQKGIRTLR